jgi:hypothetical protein
LSLFEYQVCASRTRSSGHTPTSRKKKYGEDATRQDAIDFMTYCYEQGLGKRSAYDKLVTVLQLFKRHDRTGLMEQGDWPKYVETIRAV